MSALLARPPAPRRARPDCGPRPDASRPDASRPATSGPVDGPTLDDVVSRTWEVLRAELPVDCLVCGHELTPRHGAGPAPVGGRCDGCGSAIG